MRSRSLQYCLLLSAVGVAGCTDSVSPPPKRLGSPVRSVASFAEARNADEQLLALSQDIQHFGGFHVDARGKIHLLLTDSSDRTRAIETLVSALRSLDADSGTDREIDFSNVTVELVAYEIPELSRWRMELNNIAFGLDGVVSSDLDEVNNILVYGVVDQATGSTVRTYADALGIPSGALSFRIRSRVLPMTDSLLSVFRPVPGGVQIQIGDSLCTSGFNAYVGSDPVPRLIVASHCTVPNLFDGATVYQPTSTSSIGSEINDRQPFTYLLDPTCPQTDYCRYSDAAIVGYASGTAGEFKIARTTFFGLDSGSKIIDANNPRFSVIGKKTLGGQVGDTVHKVGRTTGWTKGAITDVCVHIQFGSITLLCQTAAALGIDEGDSGAPVFQRTGTSGQDARLVGQAWGRYVENGQYWLMYSPIGNIQDDFSILHVN